MGQGRPGHFRPGDHISRGSRLAPACSGFSGRTPRAAAALGAALRRALNHAPRRRGFDALYRAARRPPPAAPGDASPAGVPRALLRKRRGENLAVAFGSWRRTAAAKRDFDGGLVAGATTLRRSIARWRGASAAAAFGRWRAALDAASTLGAERARAARAVAALRVVAAVAAPADRRRRAPLRRAWGRWVVGASAAAETRAATAADAAAEARAVRAFLLAAALACAVACVLGLRRPDACAETWAERAAAACVAR